MLTALVSFALLVDRLAVIAAPPAHAPHHLMAALARARVDFWRAGRAPAQPWGAGHRHGPFGNGAMLMPLARLAVVEHIDGFLTCRAPHDVTQGSSSIGALDLEAGGVADFNSASMMTEA